MITNNIENENQKLVKCKINLKFRKIKTVCNKRLVLKILGSWF